MSDATKRILVVDDESSITEFVGYALKKEGYVVDVFDNGEDALTAARKRSEQGFVERLGTLVADLAMDGASFEISFAELPFASWNADGPHKVEFLYSPAVGLQSRPLARIASGG